MIETPSPDWLASGAAHLWRPYTQMKTAPPALPVRATDGVRIMLSDGAELVDGVASWWTAVHGYNHPHIRAAVTRQLDIMPHVMLGGLAHEPACRLAARLAAIAPGDLAHVFFSESGSVSVEIAMKMAVQYWINCGAPARRRFVSFEGGYHGDTFATMSVCDPEEGMHRLFAGAFPAQYVRPLPRAPQDAEALDAFIAAHDDIAGIIVEPLIQGAGGMRVFSPDVLGRLRAICDRRDVLLIFDEIFTGFGRTGKMFASQQAEVAPDIMTVSKALTGGVLPLAATIASASVYDAFLGDDPARALMHGPTYTGNALACAAANASLDLFEREPRLEQVTRIEAQLRAELGALSNHSAIREIRVCGAMGVVELDIEPDLERMKREFLDRGVFIRPIGRAVYLTPAYVIAQTDLTQLTDAIAHVLRSHFA